MLNSPQLGNVKTFQNASNMAMVCPSVVQRVCRANGSLKEFLMYLQYEFFLSTFQSPFELGGQDAA